MLKVLFRKGSAEELFRKCSCESALPKELFCKTSAELRGAPRRSAELPPNTSAEVLRESCSIKQSLEYLRGAPQDLRRTSAELRGAPRAYRGSLHGGAPRRKTSAELRGALSKEHFRRSSFEGPPRSSAEVFGGSSAAATAAAAAEAAATAGDAQA
eukprot:gene17913-biopygen4295